MPPPMMARSKLSGTSAPRRRAILSQRMPRQALTQRAWKVEPTAPVSIRDWEAQALRLGPSAAIGAIGDLEGKRRTLGRVAQADDAAMSVDQLLGHREPKPRTALACGALECLEEMRARLLGHAWTVVADLDGNPHPVAQCANPDLTDHILLLLNGLHGIARKVAQDAKELIAIRVNAQRGIHVHPPIDGSIARQPETIADLLHQWAQRHQLAPRRCLFGAPELQRAVGEMDGPVERGDELWSEALHGRVGQAAEPVRDELGVGEHIAQIVIDLADRQTQRGKPALLLQRLGELALHMGELTLGRADLVAAR